MKDIVIAILKFPNDPTGNRSSHQMLVSELTSNRLNLFSVSSILGKERRVYGPNRDDNLTII